MTLKCTQLLAVLLLGTPSLAQELSVIHGNVKDDLLLKNMESATIAIVRGKDSSLVKAALSDKEGNFYFEKVNRGTYRILATSPGFKKTYSPPITVEGLNIGLGTIFLVHASKSLTDVVIVSRKSFIERKIDKTVINIDASILSAGSTAMEILEAGPGVSVNKEGSISLKGKSGVTIMIDGKPTYLSGQQLTDLLKSMPASALSQVEIMTNPSAKYDAAGNAGIINIRTKKNKAKGFNANVSTSYGQNISSNSNQGIQMNYRAGKWNVFGNYTFSHRAEYRDLDILRKFRDKNTHQIESIFDQHSSLRKKSNSHNTRLGIDFYAGDKTTLGMVFDGNFTGNKSADDNTSLLQNSSGHTDSSLHATSMVRGQFRNSGINLNFKHRFDSTGKELTTDIDYIDFRQSDVQLFDNNYFHADMSVRKPANQLRGGLPADVRVYSAKADYSHPLGKGAKFETGIKSSYVTTDNKAMYYNLKGSSWVPDYGKTNHFGYNEHINAAYINYNMHVKKWALQAGLRAENTIATGRQSGNQVSQDSAFRKNYTVLFPTAFVSYDANGSNTFSASIGRRIGRPDYQSLNPFYYFLDDYTYRVGNTQLQPQYTNSIEVSHTYEGILTTTLNYSKTTDLFSETFKQNTRERTFIITHENIASREETGISVGATVPVSKTWSSNLYTNFAGSKWNGTIDGSSLNVSGTVFTGNVNNQFRFKKGWSAELNGWYRSKSIEGQIRSDPMWAINTGVQKEILKKKGILKLGIRDVFNSQQFAGVLRYDDIDAKIVNNNFPRTTTLTFSYRFGKPVKSQQAKNNGGAADEQNRIKRG